MGKQTLEQTLTVDWKIFAISGNRNSFGLRGFMLMQKNGVVYEVGANHLNNKQVGDIVTTSVAWIPDAMGDCYPEYDFWGYEIPERMPDAPQVCIDEVWGTEN
jgi:hypothetical protein